MVSLLLLLLLLLTGDDKKEASKIKPENVSIELLFIAVWSNIFTTVAIFCVDKTCHDMSKNSISSPRQ